MAIIQRRPSGAASSAPAATRGTRYRAAEEEPAASSNGSSRSRRVASSDEAGSARSGSSRRASREEEAPKRQAARGWAAARKVREETSTYGNRFKLREDGDWTLMAFAEDEPFDSAPRHFIRELRGKGQMSFICPGKLKGRSCALDDYGDQAMPFSYFNVVEFDNDGNPAMKVWECGPGFTNTIEGMLTSRSVNGHLTNVYFEVRGKKAASGKGATTLEMNVIRPSELPETWKIDPLTDDEWDDLMKDAQGDDYVKYATEAQLREAVDKLNGLGD